MCVSVRTTAPVWITSYTLRAYCTATVIGRHGDTRLNQTVSLLLPWPAGRSSDVLTLRAAATAHHNFCSPVTLRHKKHREPVACLCFVLVVSTLPPFPPSSPPHAERAPVGPSWVFRHGESGWSGNFPPSSRFLSLSLSLAVSPSPPERLLHHCSATINSSVQISCKLPKQTSALTSAPQHTHTRRSPKFRPPRKQHTYKHTHTHARSRSPRHTRRTMPY